MESGEPVTTYHFATQELQSAFEEYARVNGRDGALARLEKATGYPDLSRIATDYKATRRDGGVVGWSMRARRLREVPRGPSPPSPRVTLEGDALQRNGPRPLRGAPWVTSRIPAAY
jgi:hypothetical protein